MFASLFETIETDFINIRVYVKYQLKPNSIFNDNHNEPNRYSTGLNHNRRMQNQNSFGKK